VEQKNYALLRRLVGYLRDDTERELQLLGELYLRARLSYNFFQVVMKLQSKERRGSKVRKRDDEPKTPYQRLREANDISQEGKARLEKISKELNVVKLKKEIEKLQEKLWRMQKEKKNCPNFRIDS